MKGKIFFAAFAALITCLAVADFVTVYENDFESYQLGEVRKPVQDGAPFVEYNAPTNLIYCNVEHLGSEYQETRADETDNYY